MIFGIHVINSIQWFIENDVKKWPLLLSRGEENWISASLLKVKVLDCHALKRPLEAPELIKTRQGLDKVKPELQLK